MSSAPSSSASATRAALTRAKILAHECADRTEAGHDRERGEFPGPLARRKADVAKAEAQSTPATKDHADTAPERETADELPFDIDSLPSLEQITAETDIRPFMHALVPADLRNAALRRMWELDTAIRDYVSPATEYAWDWNDGGNAPGIPHSKPASRLRKRHFACFPGRKTDYTLVGEATPSTEDQAHRKFRGSACKGRCNTVCNAQSVEMETVRLSTKSDTIPSVSSASASEASRNFPAKL